MSLATATAPLASRVVEHHPHKFTDLEKGLEAAKGHFPTSYIVGICGNLKQASAYAHNAETIRGIAQVAKFGAHRDDILVIWLPGEQQPE